jgi:hypothetical protein
MVSRTQGATPAPGDAPGETDDTRKGASLVRTRPGHHHNLEAFLVPTGIVALAEISDRTQLWSILLAARF